MLVKKVNSMNIELISAMRRAFRNGDEVYLRKADEDQNKPARRLYSMSVLNEPIIVKDAFGCFPLQTDDVIILKRIEKGVY